MPEFFDSDSKFPMVRFSSKLDVESYFRPFIKNELEKSGLHDIDVEYFINKNIESIQLFAFEKSDKDGTILQSAIESARKSIIREAGIIRDAAAKSATFHSKFVPPSVPETSTGPTELARRKMLFAGLAALGGIASIHGAISAATAVKKDEKNQRDWNRTALHTGEALLGAAVSWASIVAMQKSHRAR